MVHIEDTQDMNTAVSPYLCSLPPSPRSPSDLQWRDLYGQPTPPALQVSWDLAVNSEYDHPRV